MKPKSANIALRQTPAVKKQFKSQVKKHKTTQDQLFATYVKLGKGYPHLIETRL